jgi:hypothetical protein
MRWYILLPPYIYTAESWSAKQLRICTCANIYVKAEYVNGTKVNPELCPPKSNTVLFIDTPVILVEKRKEVDDRRRSMIGVLAVCIYTENENK